MKKAIAALGVCFVLTGCAGNVKEDPLEGYNRAAFGFNEAVDKAAIKPVAEGYDELPSFIKTAVNNFFGNLKEPARAVNHLLQGNPELSAKSVGRFVFNSTFGIAGLIDISSYAGVEAAPANFGDTFKAWGVGTGGYLVLPILGPTTVRDALALPLDFLADPVALHTPIPERNVAVGLRGVDDRSNLLSADKLADEASLDKYSFVRDAVMQKRMANAEKEKALNEEK